MFPDLAAAAAEAERRRLSRTRYRSPVVTPAPLMLAGAVTSPSIPGHLTRAALEEAHHAA